MRRHLPAFLLLLAACSAQQPEKQSEAPAGAEAGSVRSAVAPILDAPDAQDVHSYARPREARVTHVALDLRTDFAARRIGGTATLDVQAPLVGRRDLLVLQHHHYDRTQHDQRQHLK